MVAFILTIKVRSEQQESIRPRIVRPRNGYTLPRMQMSPNSLSFLSGLATQADRSCRDSLLSGFAVHQQGLVRTAFIGHLDNTLAILDQEATAETINGMRIAVPYFFLHSIHKTQQGSRLDDGGKCKPHFI